MHLHRNPGAVLPEGRKKERLFKPNSVLTHSYTAGLLHGNALYVSFCNLIDKRIENGPCSGGYTAGCHTDDHSDF